MNKAIILGRLGQDPELRHTSSGAAVVNLSVATSERYQDNGEWLERTEWHRIVVFGRQAESCAQYLTKGREVAVDGRIQTREWSDKDGAKRSSTEIVASHVQFVGGRGDNAPRQSQGSSAENTPIPDDEIPF